MAEKEKRGEINKTIEKEADVLKVFYASVDGMFKEYEESLTAQRHELMRERMTSKLLEKELAKLMMSSMSMDHKEVIENIQSSNFSIENMNLDLPVKFRERETLDDDKFQKIKQKFKTGTKLQTILNHYILTENQLIELIDNA
jgi:hypothetical protein